MRENMQAPTNANEFPEMQTDWNSNSASNLLPSDAQLDRLVDNLCDTFSSVKVKLDFDENSISSDSQDFTDSSGSVEALKLNEINHVLPPSLSTNLPENQCVLNNTTKMKLLSLPLLKTTESNTFFEKKLITTGEKRFYPNGSLNQTIQRCRTSLEQLIEERKKLEMLVQMQKRNYLFPYTPRLPDTPTKVDRLVGDVKQERCRILGLVSNLEETVNSFLATSTKDELRQLLVIYGRAIDDVIKERHTEINLVTNGINHDTGILKLNQLLDLVDRLTRKVNTAIWCIRLKERGNMEKSQRSVSAKYLQLNANAGPLSTQQRTPWTSHSSNFGARVPLPTRMITAGHGYRNKLQAGQYALVMGVKHQQTVYEVMPSSSSPSSVSKQRSSSTVQLFAQQQRAETFHHYSSTLKSNCNSGIK